jgi:hypothetical protein
MLLCRSADARECQSVLPGPKVPANTLPQELIRNTIHYNERPVNIVEVILEQLTPVIWGTKCPMCLPQKMKGNNLSSRDDTGKNIDLSEKRNNFAHLPVKAAKPADCECRGRKKWRRW